MVIIEGPDGAGKTTLKEALLNWYPQMREGPRGTKDRSKLYTVTVADTFGAINRAMRAAYSPKLSQTPSSLCVWDRLFFSEMVYAGLVGRPCEFTPSQQAFITRVLETIGCPIILCLPPYEAVRENAEVHEQMKGVRENLRAIYDAYEDMYHRMPNQTVKFDYTGTAEDAIASLDYVTQTVIDPYITERGKRAWSQG